ncbi:hypothetical protein MMC29_004446 [Sticta canariensis]|nr:hypothetical protein [Sticta canariensis]
MNSEFHIESSFALYRSIFNRHKDDKCSQNIVHQLELQSLAFLQNDSLEIVRARCTGDQQPSVIRALFVTLHLCEQGMSVPNIMAAMATQCFHFPEAFVAEMMKASFQQVLEGSVPVIWGLAFALHRHSLGDSAQCIAEELEKYWFEISESLVEGVIGVQLERTLILQQES